MIIGIQGIQGSGKSTLVENLCKKNKKIANISIDDFYLSNDNLKKQYYYTREKRWAQRGNPGTHDIQLMISVLRDFKQNIQNIEIPIYDKSAHNGEGDRVGCRFLSNCQVLLVEGWCIGFASKGLNDKIDEKVKEYEEINKYLDALIILKAPYLDIVYEWREEAEIKLRQDSKGMDKDRLRNFIDMYMWCYKEYLPSLYDNPPTKLCMIMTLDRSRNICDCKLMFKPSTLYVDDRS